MESIDDAVEDNVPLTNRPNACQQVDYQECQTGAGVITQHRVVAADGWTTPGEEPITWLSRPMVKRSGADSRTMLTANRGLSSAQLTQRSFESTKFPSPRIQHETKEIPLTPTTRRPLQRRCQHRAHPSPQKRAPHRVWVASTITAPSGVCLTRVRAPRCTVE